MKHRVALPLLLYFFTSFLSSYSLIITIFAPDFEEVGVKIQVINFHLSGRNCAQIKWLEGR